MACPPPSAAGESFLPSQGLHRLRGRLFPQQRIRREGTETGRFRLPRSGHSVPQVWDIPYSSPSRVVRLKISGWGCWGDGAGWACGLARWLGAACCCTKTATVSSNPVLAISPASPKLQRVHSGPRHRLPKSESAEPREHAPSLLCFLSQDDSRRHASGVPSWPGRGAVMCHAAANSASPVTSGGRLASMTLALGRQQRRRDSSPKLSSPALPSSAVRLPRTHP